MTVAPEEYTARREQETIEELFGAPAVCPVGHLAAVSLPGARAVSAPPVRGRRAVRSGGTRKRLPRRFQREAPLKAQAAGAVERSPEMVAIRTRCKYTRKHTMATSVHIPKPLLEAVDRRARALKMSRNRLIVKALERELSGRSSWSEGFFERLSEVDEATSAATDEMLSAIRASRRSKEPRQL